MPRLSIALLLIVVFCGSAVAQSVPPRRYTPLPVSPVNWNSVNSELTQELRQAEIGALVQQELHSPSPATPKSWLRKLALLVRVDYPVETLQLLHTRPRFLPKGQDWAISQLANESSSYDNLPLAKRLCELFPEQTSAYSWFDKWTRNVTPKIADSWLAEQGSAGEERWFRERLKFRGRLGTEKELLAPLEANIRRHPHQLEPVEIYLRAVQATEKPQNTDWIAKEVTPKLAVENHALAGYLKSSAAIPVFERVLTLPFTTQDAEWYRDYIQRMHFAYFSPGFVLTATQLYTWTKGNLLRLYQETNQTAKAQEMLEDIAAQQKNGISKNFPAFQSGEIQGSSGARVIEKRIQAAEPEQKNTPDYWLTRAQYYSGRKEDAQAVEAFEKGLVLAPLPADGALTMRWQIVMEYARHLWLRDPENPTDAARFIHKEFDTAPLNSDYARGLITLLLNYGQKASAHLLTPDDARLWEFLAVQPDWRVHGRMLLDHLIRNAKPQRETILKRAEEMAKDSPSANRSLALATLMTTLGEYARAPQWVEDAIERLTDKDEKESARNDLWQAYRYTEDWRGMQRLMGERDVKRNPDYFATTALYDIAMAAAMSGAKREAWQYFVRWANQDRRSAPSQVYPLPSKGLLGELRSYYRKMAQDEPQSATPARVLKMIGSE